MSPRSGPSRVSGALPPARFLPVLLLVFPGPGLAPTSAPTRPLVQEEDYVPRKAPPLEWETFYEEDPTSLAALKGKAVVLYFFATWLKSNEEAFEKLARWDRKFGERGLRIVAVSEERSGKVRQWEEKHRPKFPVVRASMVSKTFDLDGLPTLMLISAEGRILEPDMDFEDRLVESALADVRLPLPIPDRPAFGRLKSLWENGRFGEFAKELSAALKAPDLDKKARKDLNQAGRRLQAQLRNIHARIEILMRGPDLLHARKELKEILKRYRGLSAEESARKALARFRKDRDLARDLKEQKALARLRRLYRPERGESDRRKLVLALRSFIAKAKGFKSRTLARRLLSRYQ